MHIFSSLLFEGYRVLTRLMTACVYRRGSGISNVTVSLLDAALFKFLLSLHRRLEKEAKSVETDAVKASPKVPAPIHERIP